MTNDDSEPAVALRITQPFVGIHNCFKTVEAKLAVSLFQDNFNQAACFTV